MVFKRWHHKFLNFISVSAPVLFSFCIGVMAAAKLFNPEVKMVLVDWTLIGIFLFIIWMFQKERWNDLNKTFAVYTEGVKNENK